MRWLLDCIIEILEELFVPYYVVLCIIVPYYVVLCTLHIVSIFASTNTLPFIDLSACIFLLQSIMTS